MYTQCSLIYYIYTIIKNKNKMDTPSRERYDDLINTKRFFDSYGIPFTPPALIIKGEDQDQYFGWDLSLSTHNLELGKVKYRILSIEKCKNGWDITMLKNETHQWKSISLDMVTPGWENKWAKIDGFYQEALKQLKT